MAGAHRTFSVLVSAGSPAFWYTDWILLEMPLEKKPAFDLVLGFKTTPATVSASAQLFPK